MRYHRLPRGVHYNFRGGKIATVVLCFDYRKVSVYNMECIRAGVGL
jgi:hypothetical protein